MQIIRKTFFNKVRPAFFDGHLTQSQTDGLSAILDYWENEFTPNTDLRWLAYYLATAYHETDRTIAAIREYGRGQGKRYGRVFYGRGLVQLTWRKNYQTMSDEFGVNLVKNPDKALDLNLAVKIMFYGMNSGTFGGKLSTYIKGKKCDYVGARHTVNGTDKSNLIADYARIFEQILTDSAARQSSDASANSIAVNAEVLPEKPAEILPTAPPDNSPSDNGISAAGNSVAETGADDSPPQNNGGSLDNSQPNQSAEQITNISTAEKTVPDGFTPETKEMPAPAPDASTATATKMTIAGFAVPTFLVGIIQAFQSAMANGYIDAKTVGDAVIGFISNNTKYAFGGIALVIVGMIFKKAWKQLSFMLSMYLTSRPDRHNIVIVPQEKKEI